MKAKVCFLGGSRYSEPLDPTSAKKFEAMRALGELFVIGFSADLWPRRFREHAQFYLLPQLPIAALRYLEVFLLGQIVAFWLVFRHGVRVIVTQSPYEGVAAAWVKKLGARFGRKITLIVESHGDFEESLFMQRRILLPGLYRRLMRSATRFALRNADLLRAVSNSTREQLNRWAPDKPAVQFVAWTDIETFLKAGAERTGSLSQVILYAGVLIPRKGIHHLITAFGRIAGDFPRARLVIAGPEDNRTYAARLKAQIAQAALNERVELTGMMPQTELACRMRQACVLVLPTYSEGLPRVVYEAMAAGLPVVASAVSGIPELVRDGETGFLIVPGDINTLAERIRWILEHAGDSQAMGRRARAIAEQTFSAEAFVAFYRRMFEKNLQASEQNSRAHTLFQSCDRR